MKNTFFGITFGALFLLFAGTAVAQPTILDKSSDQVKLFNAGQAFNGGDYVKALNLYKEVQANKPNDAAVAYHVGECQFALKDYDDALSSFEKAKGLAANAHPDLNLMLGKSYQVKGQTDKAIEVLKEFLASAPSDNKRKDGDCHLKQCENAKALKAKPVNVTVTNVGPTINSPYDDKRPSITADGQTMIFSSRRPEGKSSEIDKEGDSNYFEDIYLATWNAEKQNWGEGDLIKGSVNSPGHDAVCSISPDGKQMFIYQNDIETGTLGGDILVSKRSSSGKWGSPRNMGKIINTSYFEDGGILTADGKKFYIMSERGQDLPYNNQRGFGNSDIWVADKSGKSNWAKPNNLGNVINSEFDEGSPYPVGDGKTLYFCSNGPGSMGGYDIFKTTFENGSWSAPVNMGYPINTIGNETSFILAPDGKTAYIASDREGTLGERDIWAVDMTELMKPKAALPIPKSVLRGTVFDANGVPATAEISVYDESGAKVATVQSNASGNYEVQLDGGKNYETRIEIAGFKKIAEKFELKNGAEGGPAFELVKHFILYKE